MEPNEQYCWELKSGKLVPAKDPIPTDDGNFEALLASAGYLSEISSVLEPTHSNAEVVIYKNAKSDNGNPLFYIDVMGNRTGIASLIARDFPQLVETMNLLAGLMAFMKMDQSAAIFNA